MCSIRDSVEVIKDLGEGRGFGVIQVDPESQRALKRGRQMEEKDEYVGQEVRVSGHMPRKEHIFHQLKKANFRIL